MSLRLSTRQFCRPYYRPTFSSAGSRLAQFSHAAVKPTFSSVRSSARSRLAQFSHAAVNREEKAEDPRLKEEVGDLIIEDQYAILREKYGM